MVHSCCWHLCTARLLKNTNSFAGAQLICQLVRLHSHFTLCLDITSICSVSPWQQILPYTNVLNSTNAVSYIDMHMEFCLVNDFTCCLAPLSFLMKYLEECFTYLTYYSLQMFLFEKGHVIKEIIDTTITNKIGNASIQLYLYKIKFQKFGNFEFKNIGASPENLAAIPKHPTKSL